MSELAELPKSTYLVHSYVQVVVNVLVTPALEAVAFSPVVVVIVAVVGSDRKRFRDNGSSLLILCQYPVRGAKLTAPGIWQCECSAGLCSWAWAAGIWTRECISRLCRNKPCGDLEV